MSVKHSDKEAAAVAIAPRVSLAHIEAKIASEHHFTMGVALEALDQPVPPSTDTLSVCLLVMTNGFTIIGKSAPASPENFNADLGKKFAREDAIRQLWPLEGYLLRSLLPPRKTPTAALSQGKE